MTEHACLACTAPVIACMIGIDRIWLDAATQPVAMPDCGLIAFNPATQGGRRIDRTNVQEIDRWHRAGRITLHLEHDQVCDPQPVLQGFPRG